MKARLRILALALLAGLCGAAGGVGDAADAARAPTVQEENARLARENEALRRENQRLRSLLVQRGAREGAAPAAQAGEQAGPEPEFWLSAKSDRRHNPGCRLFKKTRGRPCGKGEGKPCGICGG